MEWLKLFLMILIFDESKCMNDQEMIRTNQTRSINSLKSLIQQQSHDKNEWMGNNTICLLQPWICRLTALHKPHYFQV